MATPYYFGYLNQIVVKVFVEIRPKFKRNGNLFINPSIITQGARQGA